MASKPDTRVTVLSVPESGHEITFPAPQLLRVRFEIYTEQLPFTRVPDGAGRRRKRQKLRENSASETRQAMAVITLARSCPYTSMALALSILRLVATAWTQVGTTPLERVVFESRPGRVSPKYHTGWSDHGGKNNGKDRAEGAFDA